MYSDVSTAEERTRVASWFGKLSVRYTAARVFTVFEGDATQCPYRVVASDADSIAIVCRTEGRNEIRHIRFISEDLYWVSVGRNREFFARVAHHAPHSKGSRPSAPNEA